jgi:lysozyme
MRRSPAVLALALAAAAVSAAAQEFAGADGLAAQFSGFRAQAQAQKAIPQAPPVRAMGVAGRSEATALAAADAVPNVGEYPVRGIDISHFQLTIDWDKVKTDGLSFVYIKATEGADGVDDDFVANWKGAEGAGLARGAYHFYNFCKTGSEQAANFIKTVPADAGVLPATIDLEQSGDCKTMPEKTAFRKDLADFVVKVLAAYGRLPILYVNYKIYDKYFKGENDSYKLWISDVSHEAPSMPDNSSWTMWQYGWHGSVAGVPGEVDLDVFNGTPQMLASLEAGGVMLASFAAR